MQGYDGYFKGLSTIPRTGRGPKINRRVNKSIKIRGRVFILVSTHEKMTTAEEKVRKYRKEGKPAVIRPSFKGDKVVYPIYIRK